MTELSNSDLLIQLKASVSRERDLLVKIISLLEEVDRRRLFLEMGYGSLMEFCIKELGYAEAAAYRRIAAMRVVRDVPATVQRIESGELSLAVIAQAQIFFRAEEREKGEKLDCNAKTTLLEQLSGLSVRQAEKLLLEKSPEHLKFHNQLKCERVRSVTPTKSELRLTLSDETLQKLNQLKLLLSHKIPNANYADIIDEITRLALQKLDPQQQVSRSAQSAPKLKADVLYVSPAITATAVTSKTAKNSALISRMAASAASIISTAKIVSSKKIKSDLSALRRKTLPVNVKRMVWRRSQGQCCFVDSSTNRRCSSRYQLQIDHRKPVAKGGTNDISNLQLLCRAHNSYKGFR